MFSNGNNIFKASRVQLCLPFFHLYLGELIAILFLNEVGREDTDRDVPEGIFQWDYTDITGLYGCLEKQFLHRPLSKHLQSNIEYKEVRTIIGDGC